VEVQVGLQDHAVAVTVIMYLTKVVHVMWNSLQQYHVQQYEIQIFFQVDFLCDGYIS
jgi:hypothetical protein